MLANSRFCLLFFSLLASLLLAGPLAGQVHGVPASVTSIGFGGNNGIHGVRASVTSLGPNSFPNAQNFLGNCCSNFFFPPGSLQFGLNPQNPLGRHHHRRDDLIYAPVAVPAYVPYPVPYAYDPDDDPADDPAAYGDGYELNTLGSGPSDHNVPPKHPVHRSSSRAPANDPAPDPTPREVTPERVEEPVAAHLPLSLSSKMDTIPT